MSIQNKLKEVYGALTTISDDLPVFHYTASSDTKAPYLLWYEESEGDSLEAGNHKAEQSLDGWVDFFTPNEFDELVDSIQDSLNGIENLSWTLSNVSYGDPSNSDDNLIHYTWSWRIL